MQVHEPDRRDSGPEGLARVAFANSPKLLTSSTTTVGGIARIVHSGTAQAFCTASAGKKNQAIVNALAANQGQKISNPQIMRMRRICTLFCQRVSHPCTRSRNPGSKRTWLYGAALGTMTTVTASTSASIRLNADEPMGARRNLQQRTASASKTSPARGLPHSGVISVSRTDSAPSLYCR